VQALVLEHYPGMTEKALSEIVQQARSRWDVLAWRVIHRVGELHAGDQIVYVGIASTHRGDAFAAAEFIMDYLKTRAPFWKKQRTEAESQWIESRSADEQARARWDKR
jgi:molybdopterin synthase catalytic subunit